MLVCCMSLFTFCRFSFSANLADRQTASHLDGLATQSHETPAMGRPGPKDCIATSQVKHAALKLGALRMDGLATSNINITDAPVA